MGMGRVERGEGYELAGVCDQQRPACSTIDSTCERRKRRRRIPPNERWPWRMHQAVMPAKDLRSLPLCTQATAACGSPLSSPQQQELSSCGR